MSPSKAKKSSKTGPKHADSTNHLKARASARQKNDEVHVFGKNKSIRCDTDARGHATPGDRSPLELVLHASEGFVPLWAPDTTLRWRFRESSLSFFQNPSAAKNEIRRLIGEAMLAWDDAAPIKLAERDDAWDFEVVVRSNDDCDINGCVLASAFFPDAGRHQLFLFPKLFTQDDSEVRETLVHEIGHIFGLRHFFADLKETRWPVEVFGTHEPFTIMNYGEESVLTANDKADLKRLYRMAWSGQLTDINGTPIKLMKPFHTVNTPPNALITVGQEQPAAAAPFTRAAYLEGYRPVALAVRP
jgi:hypothetical protein